ncbi:hypothetical protein KGF54_002153 [Candida jiufengensis]|uniref:uncharacterized protein n=1 Tax=Candida jiufengensis TaxID=497108 RepID=UPI002224F1A8|nr:uncharacterized protein KGF54_002153 [Candida jiufengensis]KAI5954378.1 hypothetical protein KGF54_002153 [Candida jiufengensis]
MKFFTIAVAAFAVSTEAAAIYSPIGKSVEVQAKRDADLVSFKTPSQNIVLAERSFINSTITTIDQITKAIDDLLQGNFLGSAVDFGQLLITLGIDAAEAAEWGLHEGENALEIIAQLGNVIAGQAAGSTKRDVVLGDRDVITTTIAQITKAISDLLQGNLVGSAVDFGQLLVTLGIDAAQAAEWGIHEGENALEIIAQLGNVIAGQATGSSKRDVVLGGRDFVNSTITTIAQITKAISDLLEGNFLGSAVDFGQLLITLGIDAAEAAEWGLHEGENALEIIAQLGNVIAGQAAGSTKRDVVLAERDFVNSTITTIAQITKAISDLLEGNFLGSAVNFGQLLITLGIDAAEAAEWGLHEGENALEIIAQLGNVIAGQAAGSTKRDVVLGDRDVITTTIAQITKAISDLLQGNLVGSAVDFGQLLVTLGIDAAQAAEWGIHEGENALEIIAQLGNVIAGQAASVSKRNI